MELLSLSAPLELRVEVAKVVMLGLVCALGAIVFRFSRTYLSGDPALARYRRWLVLTLGAVVLLVAADNLLVMVLAWTGTSLALHQLLTLYPDRPAAQVAAHKKFLVSRLADACLAACLALVHHTVGSFDLQRLGAWVEARAQLPLSMHVAAGLLVIAVALRSAQLPFHGWLIQVMEAPTPVSALLHAGVVNIGGYVLIRLAPWISASPPAQLLLVAIGTVTTVVAALVMTTRVSVKVSLAWSTCAQMGFMLVQCGLGLWPLALLHLVAHSLYKAYAFLSAGSVVDDWKRRAMGPPLPRASALRLGAAAAVSIVLAGAVVGVRPLLVGAPPSGLGDLALALWVGLSIVPLVAPVSLRRPRAGLAAAARALGVVLLAVGWHTVAEQLLPKGSVHASPIGWALATLGLSVLVALQATLRLRPEGKLARALHPWLFSGLYLDELFTRLTFRLWPPRFPPTPRAEVTTPARVPALEV